MCVLVHEYEYFAMSTSTSPEAMSTSTSPTVMSTSTAMSTQKYTRVRVRTRVLQVLCRQISMITMITQSCSQNGLL